MDDKVKYLIKKHKNILQGDDWQQVDFTNMIIDAAQEGFDTIVELRNVISATGGAAYFDKQLNSMLIKYNEILKIIK